jgi:hypothetical protein
MANHDGKSQDMTDDLNKDDNHIIFSSDDNDRLKILGEIFGNDTSRSIITLLIEYEMTAMQISDKLDVKINLVMYHLSKMISLEIISVTKKTKNSRGHQVKHYKAKQSVLIFSKNVKDRAEKSKTLSNVIKRITRFSAIGVAGMITWFITNISIQGDKITSSMDTALKYPRPTLPPYMTPIEPQSGVDGIIPIILGVVVVVSLLIVVRIIIPRIRLHQKSQ